MTRFSINMGASSQDNVSIDPIDVDVDVGIIYLSCTATLIAKENCETQFHRRLSNDINNCA